VIAGDLSKFKLDPTSHLKSNTFIECSGGVTIGRYFHPGRGLTIWSVNHAYDSEKAIPYDETVLEKPVHIEDFVWCGGNVFIIPGVTVGEGPLSPPARWLPRMCRRAPSWAETLPEC